MDAIDEPTRRRIAERIVRGPFGQHLGFRLAALGVDTCAVRLPHHRAVENGVGVVHGGAIAALVDTAATAAAWASPGLGAASRGATAGVTVSYLSAARGHDLLATARVLRRGRAIVAIEVDVADTGGRHVARALVTYRLADVPDAEGPSILG